MSLRPYQQRAITDLYNWLFKHQGHPCLVLPTGSGKSHIVANPAACGSKDIERIKSAFPGAEVIG